MGQKKLMLQEIERRSLDDVLREILRNGEPVTVVMDEGQAVEIRPIGLKPLPVLEGSVPEGWKDGIYSR